MWKTLVRVLWGGALLLGLTFLSSLRFGVESINFSRAWNDPASVDHVIFVMRAQRAALGALIGAALSLAGVGFQALTRNPLADPFVLGISGGAALGGTIAIVLGLGVGWGEWTLPIWGFAGALAATVLVFSLGRTRGRFVPTHALLAGVVMNTVTSAFIIALRLLASPQSAFETIYWLTGTVGQATPLRLLVMVCYVALGFAFLYRLTVAMNAFVVGEEVAHILGVDADRARRLLFIASALLTAGAVAFAGPVGFVGMIVPHILRGLVGSDHRLLVPAAAVGGAAFLVAADLLSRLSFLFLGTEPTVGVVTALVGAPFFLFVLQRRLRDRWT